MSSNMQPPPPTTALPSQGWLTLPWRRGPRVTVLRPTRLPSKAPREVSDALARYSERRRAERSSLVEMFVASLKYMAVSFGFFFMAYLLAWIPPYVWEVIGAFLRSKLGSQGVVIVYLIALVPTLWSLYRKYKYANKLREYLDSKGYILIEDPVTRIEYAINLNTAEAEELPNYDR